MKIYNDNRAQLYERPTPFDRLKQAGGKGRSTIDRLRSVKHTTHGGTLDDLLRGSTGFDPDIASALSGEGIHVIGDAYRIGADRVQFVTSYGYENTLNVLSAPVFRDLNLQGYSVNAIKQNRVTPDQLLGALARKLQPYRGSKPIAAMRWRPSDGQLRVLSLYRAMQAMEMKAMSDMAAYKHLEHKDHWAEHIDQYGVDPEKVPVEERDMITKMHRPRLNNTGWAMYVPSRSTGLVHRVDLGNVPVLHGNDLQQYHMPLTTEGVTVGDTEQLFRMGRRAGPNYAKRDHFFTAHEMAAIMVVATMNKNKSKQVNYSMVPYARKQMIEFVDKLRHDVFIADKGQVKPLNGTEIENIMWRKVAQEGWAPNYTMTRRNLTPEDIGALVEVKY